jgi:hypothetical protein
MAEEPEYVRAARARAMKPEQLDPNANAYPWETMRVGEIPTPPMTQPAVASNETGGQASQPVALEEAVFQLLRANASSLGAELGKLGVRLDPRAQADLVDYCFALLAGNAGGGATGRRI